MAGARLSTKQYSTLLDRSRINTGVSASDTGASGAAMPSLNQSGSKPGSASESGNDPAPQGFVMLGYPVSVNRYWRSFKGRMVVSTEAVKYKQHVRMDYAHGGGRYFYVLPVSVEFKLHPKTTKTGEASKTRMDLDNVIKVLLDALNGVAYMDDKQVVRLVGEVSYPVPGGGLSVRVTA
jgi:crossover junction endodeoxyribonuclease RusA